MTQIRDKDTINNWYKYSGQGADKFLNKRCYNYATTNTCSYGFNCDYSHRPAIWPPRYLVQQGYENYWSEIKPQISQQINTQPQVRQTNTQQYQTPRNRYTKKRNLFTTKYHLLQSEN